MGNGTGIVIRPFDGSRADAEGLLAVERATFNESPYTPRKLQAMLTGGSQHAWLAVQDTRAVGFVHAFLVTGLRGSWWEVDLLAVHPDWRRRRLGVRLVQAAAAYGGSLAREARAVVADDNGASLRTFVRAGFQARPETCNLLIYRPAAQWMESRPTTGGRVDIVDTPVSAGLTLLVAGTLAGARPLGQAELIEVRTILYHGVWIESLAAQEDTVRGALIQHAMDRMQQTGLDEISAMVPDADGALQKALVGAGFWSLGRFRWVAARLGREADHGNLPSPAGDPALPRGSV